MAKSKRDSNLSDISLKFDIDINLLLNSNNLGVLIVDKNDDIIYVNETLCNTLEFNDFELIGTNLNAHSQNQDENIFKEKTNLRKKGVKDYYNITIRTKNNKPINFVLNTSPLYKDGKLAGIIGIFVNVSEKIYNATDNSTYNFTDFLSQTIILTDTNLKVKNIDKFGLNFLNIKEKNIGERLTIFDFIDDKHRIEIDEFIKKGTGVFKDILQIKIFDKYLINIFSNIIPLFENEKLIGFKFIFTDLSQFTELKQKFARSEEQYKIIFQKSQSALLLFDYEEGEVFEANNASAKIIGKKTKEIIGYNIDDIIKSKKNESVFKLIKENKNIKNKLFFINNKPVKIAVSFIEFYSHKNYQLSIVDYSKVIEKQEKDKKINSELKFLSKTAQYFLKMTPDDDIYKFIGQSLLEVIPNSYILTASYNGETLIVESVEGLEKNVRKILADFPKPVIGSEVKILDFRTKSNYMGLVNLDKYSTKKSFGNYNEDVYKTFRNLTNIKAHYSILITKNDEILGNISIFLKDSKYKLNNDLIETFSNQAGIAIQKLNLEKKLIIEKENAEDADKLKTTFLANMSHEIRTPMNSIIGFAEMLSKENITDLQRKKYYNFIDNSSKVLLNLIDDIIDITKIESGELKLTNTYFLPFDILKELYEIYKPNFKQVSIKFKLNIPTNIRNVKLYTDKYRLKQIVINLLTNALKFTHKGKVEFGFSIKDKFLEFFVIDTGKGISKRLQDVVFNRFNRGDVTQIQGNGLGLSISKHLTELMGGEFKLISEENKGSSFYFNIPINESDNNTIVIKEKEIDTNWKNKKILIVDDEELNFELLKEILFDTKVKIFRAKNGREAIDISNQEEIDLILMDVKMPVMDGFTATSIILENKPTQKIIAQTAYAMAGEKEKAIKIGCVDFITKPIRSKILLTKISKQFS